MRPPTSSTSDAATDGAPASRQRPRSATRRPPSTAPSTSSRAYSGLPRLRSSTQRCASSCTGPPSAASTSVRIASSLRRSSSSRCAPPSFHSETIASGHGSPERTVTTTNTPARRVAKCSTSAADAGSSNWASSTPSTIGRPAARSRSSSALSRRTLNACSGRTGRRQQTGEGAERDHRRAARRLHPLRHRALMFELGQNLASEARLADTGACSDHDAAPLLNVCPRDRRQLVVAANQRPNRSHRGLTHSTRTLRLRVGAVNPSGLLRGSARRRARCRSSARAGRRTAPRSCRPRKART